MDVIKTLEELIRIDSSNPFICHEIDPEFPETWKLEGNEQEISNYLEKKLKEAGFSVSRQLVHTDVKGQGFYNILGEKGSGKHSILFYGHMDTVTAKPWMSKQQALTPERKKIEINGKKKEVISGLGSCDMKAGVAVLLAALNGIEPEGYKLKVAFGVDEEFYSTGGNVLAKSSFMDDVKAVVVPEIDDGPNLFRGPGAITLGRLGRCGFVIRVPGTGGHGASAGSSEYVNAAVECSKIVSELEILRKSYVDSFTFFESEVPDKEAVRNAEGSFYVNKISSGDGTISIPAQAEIYISMTFTPNMSIKKGKVLFENIVKDMYREGKLKRTVISGNFIPVSVEEQKRPTKPSEAFCTHENNPFVEYVRDIIEKTVGFKCFTMGYSVADENVFYRERKGLPIINICPVGQNFHRADEWVEIDSVMNLVTIYRKIAIDFNSFLSNL